MTENEKKTNDQLEAIKGALRQFPDGAAIEDIKAASGLELELRTLQRRLEKLQEIGQIFTSGNKRSTRYYLTKEIVEEQSKAAIAPAIPLSDAGKAILASVSAPIETRRPVGFNRAFLEGYRPNVDSYLTTSERSKLAEVGKTAMMELAAGTYAKEVMNRLLIDLSWNSSRLEGNTYSLLDTERLIAYGETTDDHSAAEAQMILNHKDAIEFLVGDVENIGFNRYTFLNLHGMLSNNLLANPAASGRLRTIEVRIGLSVYTPLVIPQLLEEMFELMLFKAQEIKDPFEQAFFIMVQLPYLQPFDDVNKRVSRLAANISLNRHNLSPLSFVDVPNDLYVQGIKGVYELNEIALLKDVFIWAYERSAARYAAIRQSLGEPDPFRLKYREQIRALVSDIVGQGLSQKEASSAIKKNAQGISDQDRAKFVEAVETELMNLHEGNFARFWISPASFKRWRETWTARP